MYKLKHFFKETDTVQWACKGTVCNVWFINAIRRLLSNRARMNVKR